VGILGKGPVGGVFDVCEHTCPQSNAQFLGATWNGAQAATAFSLTVHYPYHTIFPHWQMERFEISRVLVLLKNEAPCGKP
jgi:hypothetical protein